MHADADRFTGYGPFGAIRSVTECWLAESRAPFRRGSPPGLGRQDGAIVYRPHSRNHLKTTGSNCALIEIGLGMRDVVLRRGQAEPLHEIDPARSRRAVLIAEPILQDWEHEDATT